MRKLILLVTLCFCSVIYAPDSRIPQFSGPASLSQTSELDILYAKSPAIFPAVPFECVDPSLELTDQERSFAAFIRRVNPRLPKGELEELAKLFAMTGPHAQLLLAMAAVESEFRVKVFGDRGTSIGMMQINRDWYRKICRRSAAELGFDPRVNLHIANTLVTGLYEKFRRIAPNADETAILQAVTDGYNRGDDRAYQAFKSREPPTHHVSKVMRRYEQIN